MPHNRNIYLDNYEASSPFALQRYILKYIFLPLAALSILTFLIFAPLVFSLLENHLLGSDYVYQLFVTLDLADLLGKLYIPILERFPALNPP